MVPTPKETGFFYYFNVNIQRAEASSLVLPFTTESQPHFWLLFLESHFLGYSVAEFSIPKEGSVCSGPVITPCWNMGPQEEESAVSHSTIVYNK